MDADRDQFSEPDHVEFENQENQRKIAAHVNAVLPRPARLTKMALSDAASTRPKSLAASKTIASTAQPIFMLSWYAASARMANFRQLTYDEITYNAEASAARALHQPCE